MKLELIAEIPRPPNIEIGLMERRGSNISQVAQSFERLDVLLHHFIYSQEATFSALRDLVEDLIICWESRMNLNLDVDLLILTHTLDPNCRFDGLDDR